MTTAQVKTLKTALKREFAGKVDAEKVNGGGRYRFAVVSRRFDRMPHLDRQDAIWKVVESTLPRAATLDVSLVLAFAPKDLH